MVGGWRRAFCTTIPKDREPKIATDKQHQQQQQQQQSNSNNNDHPLPSPKLTSRFGFFSNPSTPRFTQSHSQPPVSSPNLRCRTTPAAITTASAPESPRLHCKTTRNSPRFFFRSNPSSPKSPSSFSLLKTSLRISKSRCGICLQSVKTGQGTAIFTAECSHGFHFPCIAAHVKKQGSLVCPVCSAHWKEVPLLALHQNQNQKPKHVVDEEKEEEDKNNKKRELLLKNLKVYNDDEPLMSPTASGGFIPIPESDENEEENGGEDDGSVVEEFQGFFVNNTTTPISSPKLLPNGTTVITTRSVDVKLLPEAAVVSVGRSFETYAVVLKVKAPPLPPAAANGSGKSSFVSPSNRAPIDLVTVIDVSGRMSGEKQQLMKRAMRLVISSLSSNDRLSIVAFSATSKRLLPLRRMTANGRRSARRIVDALGSIGQDACAGDAVKKAAKVLEDRRDRNPVACILLLSDGRDDRISTRASNQDRPISNISSTRFTHQNIPVHKFGFSDNDANGHAPSDDAFAKCFRGILSVMVQDLRLELGFVAGSAPAQIAAIFTCAGGQPTVIGPGSIRLGDLYADEERELLIELKVPSSAIGSHHVLSVRSSYKDPSSQKLVLNREQALLVPRPHAVRSSSPNIERLRYLFVTTRAVAESRRLIERNDLSGAHHLLYSARALLIQASSGSADEYLRGLEVELAELNSRRQQQQVQIQRQRSLDSALLLGKERGVYVDDKGEPLTPTSAWRAAERLAKVAIMRKSLNRVSDLHGFENARF